jgi:hypothetical protein
MPRRRFLVLVGAVALVAPLIGAVAMPPAASGAVAAPAAIPTSSCFPSQDNGDPVLKSFEVSTRDVDARTASQTVTFRAVVDDAGGPGAASGVVSGSVSLVSDEGGENGVLVELVPTDTGLAGALTVHPYDEAETHFLSVTLTDRAGNEVIYGLEDLEERGFPNSVSFRTDPGPAPTVLMDLDISKTTVDARRGSGSFVVSTRVRNAAGVTSVHVELSGVEVRDGDLRLLDGTATDGTWGGRVRVPAGQGTQRAKVRVVVNDVTGSSRTFGAKRLKALGARTHVLVLGRRDNASPRITKVTVMPRTVDLRTGTRSMQVTARITDVGTGARVAQIYVPNYAGPDGDNTVRLVRVSGSRRDGLWRATVELDRCVMPAGDYGLLFEARDTVRYGGTFRDSAFTVVNADIARPTAAVVGDEYEVRRVGPLTVEFDEDVAGVTPMSAVVRVGSHQRGYVGDEPTKVGGSWSCKDVAGASVDCAGGPVRTASFTPTAAMHASTWHTLILNPEGQLGVTDLVGHPYDPRSHVEFATR